MCIYSKVILKVKKEQSTGLKHWVKIIISSVF
jgi:hypothetical protein